MWEQEVTSPFGFFPGTVVNPYKTCEPDQMMRTTNSSQIAPARVSSSQLDSTCISYLTPAVHGARG
jgi:hypothetical protein